MSGVRKEFPGVVALADVDLRVRPGTVHALVGENGAGKSTLMSCLYGLVSPDTGSIHLSGREVKFASPVDAIAAGISMIPQEVQSVPDRSVMENVWLGRFPRRGPRWLGLVDHDRMRRDTARLLAEFGMNIAPTAQARTLSVSQLQCVELVRAISQAAKVVILDEPSSSLSETEVAQLHELVRRLRGDGVAVIYISHRMEEVMEISDEISIMRDGHMMGTWPTRATTLHDVITTMVGRELTFMFPKRTHQPGDVLLEARSLTSANPRSFADVSFAVRRGEVLGIGGLVGAQRTELLEAMFGLRPLADGEVQIAGRSVTPRSARQAKKARMALLTEDRRESGIVPTRSVLENLTLASLGDFTRGAGVLHLPKAREVGMGYAARLNVRTPSPDASIVGLSGGNQQKVLFARWLMTRPDILLLDEPTRGIDVGAKHGIYTIINELAAAGTAIVMVSSELPELLGVSDRIVVMCRGRVTGVVDAQTTDQATIMRLATDLMEEQHA
jgi:methyl-galactoside transport system ATP-binding protein